MISRKMYDALHAIALDKYGEAAIRWNTAIALERRGYVEINGHAYDVKPENEALNWLMCYFPTREQDGGK